MLIDLKKFPAAAVASKGATECEPNQSKLSVSKSLKQFAVVLR